MNTKQKLFVDSSMDRIKAWAKQTGCELPAILMTGIYAELNTMFSTGFSKGSETKNEEKLSNK